MHGLATIAPHRSAVTAVSGRLIHATPQHLGADVRSIALANQKGGVGKTTTAIHLAHGLALAGHRVVLFDLDPQGNATVALQSAVGEPTNGAAPLHERLLPVGANFWLLPSPGLGSGEAALDREDLRRLHDELAPQVDWLIVDNPPRMDGQGRIGVELSDEVVVPVQAEFLAMHGLSQMLGTLETIATQVPGKGRLRGILPTMVDAREPVAVEVLEDLRRNLTTRMLQSVIFRDASLVEAASFGRTAFQHCPWSKGALCYAELVQELTDGGSTTR